MKKNETIDRNNQDTWHIAIGKPAYESIAEMVAALDKETAAEQYAANITREKAVELLTEAGIECRDEETVEELREAVAVNIADETITPDDFEFDEEEARQRIEEDPLSLEVRSDWYAPGSEDNKPAEFCILLTTGGPAVRIVGDLDEHGQPSRPRLQVQDWGKPWTEYFDVDCDVLQKYVECFYYGE